MSSWDNWSVVLKDGGTVYIMSANLPSLPHVQIPLDQIMIPDYLWRGQLASRDGRDKIVPTERFVVAKESLKVWA